MAPRFEKLTEQDRDELLSAYLDGELDAGERARLEARLAADPALRSELEALRRTAAMVRDLPVQSVPRNFILPQTMAPEVRAASKARPTSEARRPRWLAPFLTAASAAVSLLFVAALAGELLFSPMGGMTQLAVPAADEAVVESASAERVAEEEGEAPQMLAITEAPEEMAKEAPPAVAEADETIVSEEALPATPSPALPGATGEVRAEGDTEEYAEPTSTASGSPGPAAGGGELPTEPSAPSPTPGMGEAADTIAPSDTPEAEKIAPAPLPVPATPEPTEPAGRITNGIEEPEPPQDDGGWDVQEEGGTSAFADVTLWRVAEIALGVITLLLILATVLAWRARRR